MSPRTRGNGGHLRVATWNVREGIPDHSNDISERPRVLAAMTEMVSAQGVNVLALQEVDFSSDGESTVLKQLTSTTELRYANSVPLSASPFTPGGLAGLAIVSDAPITKRGTVLLPNPHFTIERGNRTMHLFDKGLMISSLFVGGIEVTVISVHVFPLRQFGHEAHEPSLAPIWRAIGSELERHQAPMILAGDFNTDNRNLIIEATAVRLRRAIGDRPTHRGRAIDDILYSCDLVAPDMPTVVSTLSDHDLCLVDLVVGSEHGGN